MRRFGKWILTAGILAGSAAWMTGSSPNAQSVTNPTTQLSAQTAASQTDNQLMAERIADALRKTNFRGSNIEIIFKNGVATITGKIADDRQKESATKTVLGVRGVKALDNQLVPIRQSAEPRPQIEQAVATAPAPKPKSRFSHDKHRDMQCTDCHAAGESLSSADVLLPKIETCRDCHGGGTSTAKVPSTCIMCHGFHTPDQPPMVKSREMAGK